MTVCVIQCGGICDFPAKVVDQNLMIHVCRYPTQSGPRSVAPVVIRFVRKKKQTKLHASWPNSSYPSNAHKSQFQTKSEYDFKTCVLPASSTRACVPVIIQYDRLTFEFGNCILSRTIDVYVFTYSEQTCVLFISSY